MDNFDNLFIVLVSIFVFILLMLFFNDLFIALVSTSILFLIFQFIQLSLKTSKQEQQIISLARGLQVTLYYLSNPENSERNLENVKRFYYQTFMTHLIKKEGKKWFCSNCGAENLQEDNNCFECNSQRNTIIN